MGRQMRILIGCECSGIVRRAVPGFPDYFACQCGELISTRRREPFVMKRRPHRSGYNLVTLIAPDGTRMNTTLHRVVAMAFHDNPTGLPCVRHLDGDKHNCRPGNLAWGSYSDNEADKITTGTRRYGTAKMKLRRADREEIATAFAAGETRAQLAARFKVDRSTISRLIAGATWTNRKWPMAEEAANR